MAHHDEQGVDRRQALECMIWAGTGVLWTLTGGVPKSSLLASAQAAEAEGFSFVQISDSHVGFDKAANPNALGTLQEAIGKIAAAPGKPAFMIHTGDITHLSKAKQFDDADQVIGQAKLDVHYVPGEHDVIDEGQGKAYLDRYGKNAKGAGWYAFDQAGIHFIGLVNVVNLKAGGMGNLGAEQLAWLEADLAGRSASTPIVVFAHIPLWTIAPEWGWGTEDFGESAGSACAVRLGHGAQRPHPSAHAEGGGQCELPHRALHRLPAARARHGAGAWADARSRRRAQKAARRQNGRLSPGRQ